MERLEGGSEGLIRFYIVGCLYRVAMVCKKKILYGKYSTIQYDVLIEHQRPHRPIQASLLRRGGRKTTAQLPAGSINSIPRLLVIEGMALSKFPTHLIIFNLSPQVIRHSFATKQSSQRRQLFAPLGNTCYLLEITNSRQKSQNEQ